jgi:hypothetical protein
MKNAQISILILCNSSIMIPFLSNHLNRKIRIGKYTLPDIGDWMQL